MPSHASSLMQWLAQSAFGMLVYVASLALVSNAVPKRSGESVFSGTAPSYASTKPSSSSGSAVEDVVVASDEAVVAAVAVVVVVDVVVVAASVRLKLYDTVPVAMGCPSDESSKHRFSFPFRCHTKMPSHASSLMQWLAQSAFGMLVYVASLALVSNAVPKRSGESVFSGTAPSYASTKPSSSSGSAVEDVVVASDEAVVAAVAVVVVVDVVVVAASVRL